MTMRALIAASVLALAAGSAHAETADEFVRGKALTMVISTGGQRHREVG